VQAKYVRILQSFPIFWWLGIVMRWPASFQEVAAGPGKPGGFIQPSSQELTA
jgi:hypothetical protein